MWYNINIENKKGVINMIFSKGELIKELKAKGVRRGDKQGATVSLEHLKYADVVNLWFEHCNEKFDFVRKM